MTHKTTISAQTILRSRNAAFPEKIVSTLLVTMPRSILAEWNTHRVFSRNAASSRAIPTEKLIAQVMDDPFIPISWGKNQKGMQAGEECVERIILPFDTRGDCIVYPYTREYAWLEARDHAVHAAKAFLEAGYHKQIVNRLLEPWMWTKVVVTSTEWKNFLALRDHPDAEPHIAALAREIRKCLDDESTVQDLAPGEWHLPFVMSEDRTVLEHLQWGKGSEFVDISDRRELIKLSVARCASTSYKTVEGFDMTLDRAVALHDKLVASHPMHASPAEHQCQADDGVRVEWFSKEGVSKGMGVQWEHPEQHGNLVGFRQYRKMLPGEAVVG